MALLNSLNKRFSYLIEQDLILVSTFLDPHFGADQFNEDKIKIVKSKLISLVRQQNALDIVKENKNFTEKNNTVVPTASKIEKKRSQNYVSYRTSSNASSNSNRIIEDEINDYIRLINDENFEFTNALDPHNFPPLIHGFI